MTVAGGQSCGRLASPGSPANYASRAIPVRTTSVAREVDQGPDVSATCARLGLAPRDPWTSLVESRALFCPAGPALRHPAVLVAGVLLVLVDQLDDPALPAATLGLAEIHLAVGAATVVRALALPAAEPSLLRLARARQEDCPALLAGFLDRRAARCTRCGRLAEQRDRLGHAATSAVRTSRVCWSNQRSNSPMLVQPVSTISPRNAANSHGDLAMMWKRSVPLMR